MTATDRLNSVLSSLAIKAPCRLATTANITLSGTQTIDGVAGAADDRILVKDQTTTTENGIYAMDTGTWVREPDFDGALDVVTGTLVFVTAGSTNSGWWYVSTTGTIVAGTSAIAFTRTSTALASISAYIQTLIDDATAALALATLTARGWGKTHVWVPAGQWISKVTTDAGAQLIQTEFATNDVTVETYDFDQTTSEGIQYAMAMPKSWDEGTITFQPIWTAASGAGTVIWSMKAKALTDDDAIDTTWGVAVTSTDTLLLADDVHIAPESAALTIGGTPAEGDLVIFELSRDISDTLSADARLIGVRIYYTTNAATDA